MNNTKQPQKIPQWQKAWLTRIALLCILLIGTYFRTINLFDWDGGTGQHPDERFLVSVTNDIHLPSSLSEYFDAARSPVNPRNHGKDFYVYGTFPPLLTRTVAVMLTPSSQLPSMVINPNVSTDPDAEDARDEPAEIPNPERAIPRFPSFVQRIFNPEQTNLVQYSQFAKVGRSLAVLFDIGSVFFIYLIGMSLYGRRVGLLAALFSALTVFQIQQAHFYVDPSFSTFFVVFGLYWAVRAAQGGGVLAHTMLGISIGCAMANRITLATLGLAGIVATFQSALLLHHMHKRSFLSALLLRRMPLLFLAGFVTLATFRIVQPYAFIGSTPTSPPVVEDAPIMLSSMHGLGFFDIRPDPRFIKNMAQIKGFISGERDFFPSQQWVNRIGYIFPLRNMVLWGMGPLLGIAAWVGWLIAGLWHVRFWFLGKQPAHYPRSLASLVLWVWVGFYFGWQGNQFALNTRYMLPIAGAISIFGAWMLVQWAERRAWRGLRLGRWVLIAVVLGTGIWAYAFTRIYTRPHSRVIAARWVVNNVPHGSKITFESWDDPLPLDVDDNRMWNVAYKGIKTFPYNADNPEKYFGREDKLDEPGLLAQLEEADYITLTSNRVYASTNRLPMRYPATMRYYHYLFNGELGFELVADITSYPSFMGIAIPDQSAEEAFSVYDHPRVLIFRKTDAFSREKAAELITGDVNWDEIYAVSVSTADKAPTALRLTESEWPTYRAAGTWSRFFDRQSVVNRMAPLVWFLVLEALGMATFAILFRLLPWLPDRGLTLARILGLLFVTYAAWILGSLHLLPFTPATVWACAAPLLIIGAWVAWHARAELRMFWRERRTAIITVEALYVAAFLLALLVRWLNPDLWHPSRGGEKHMEFAYINAILRSQAFPPYDPWYAGGSINYYYFGFVIIGTLIHMTRIIPSIAFNLAMPTIFALTVIGTWGVVYNLLSPTNRLRASGSARPMQHSTKQTKTANHSRPRPLASETHARRSALLAPFFVLLLGNLVQMIWFYNGYAFEQAHRPEWAYWDATRIVEGTVNEFPFFTFLFADVHPHMIVMPLSLGLLGVSVALVRMRLVTFPRTTTYQKWGAGVQALWRSLPLSRLSTFIVLLLMGFLAGAIRVTNTWDYPTYTGLAIVALGLMQLHAFRRTRLVSLALPANRLPPWGWWWSLFFSHVLSWGAMVALIVLVGKVLFFPFSQHFATESSGVELLHNETYHNALLQVLKVERTSLGDLLRIYGLWLFMMVSTGFIIAHRWIRLRSWFLGILSGLLIGLIWVSVTSGFSALLVLIPLLIGAMVMAWYLHNLLPRIAFPLWWGTTAIAICTGVEILVVKGDVGRMNTVFKFGLHAWTLFGLTAAIALPWIWHISDAFLWRRKKLAQSYTEEYTKGIRRGVVAIGDGLSFTLIWLWRGAVVALIIASLFYPFTATPARIADRYAEGLPRTLDGAAFMHYVNGDEDGYEFPLEEDAEAIAWLQDNVQGTPLLLEAHLPAYRWGARVATYTGLPTMLGWEWHQIQQRSIVGGPFIDRRKEAVEEIYGKTDTERALELIRHYGFEYVYVGGVEHALYDAAGLDKFEEMADAGYLEELFCTGNTIIYGVVQPGIPTMLTTDIAVNTPYLDMPPPLMLTEPVNTLPVAYDYAWNDWANRGSLHAVVVWLVALYVLALLGYPIAVLVFGRWRDAGFAWARVIGLLVLGYAIWLPTSLNIWTYARHGMLGGVVLVLALDVAVLIWLGHAYTAPTSLSLLHYSLFLRGVHCVVLRAWHCRRYVMLSEVLFLTGFVLFVVIRALNPDLWHNIWGGEKPMEFGFLNAILRSPVMPPYDPFFSGGSINYYYYGLYLVSLPIKATGISPAIGFNLVIATLFALTLLGGYAVVAQLTRRTSYGLIGAAFLVLAGNMASVFQVSWLLRGRDGIQPVLAALFPTHGEPASLWERLTQFGPRLGDWFVGASRVIDYTINEFPFWSFLFADLHPHMIVLPIVMLAIALAYQYVVGRHKKVDASGAMPATPPEPMTDASVIIHGLTALTLGGIAVTNSWDFPTYALLIGAALVGHAWRTRPLHEHKSSTQQCELCPPDEQSQAMRQERTTAILQTMVQIARAGLLAIALAVGGLALYSPFFDSFYAFVSGIGLVRDGTHIRDYGLLYGLFVVVLVPVLIGAAWRLLSKPGFRGWLMSVRMYEPAHCPPISTKVGLGTQKYASTNPETHTVLSVSQTHAYASSRPQLLSVQRLLSTSPFVGILLSVVLAMLQRIPAFFQRASRSQSAVHIFIYSIFMATLFPIVSVIIQQVRIVFGREQHISNTAFRVSRLVSPDTPSPHEKQAASGAQGEESVSTWVKLEVQNPAPDTYCILPRPQSTKREKVFSIIGRMLLVLVLFMVFLQAIQHPATELMLCLETLILIGVGLMLPRCTSAATWFTFLMATVAWSVSLGIELLFIQDHLAGGDFYRMNTVFKFGMQIWTLLALAAAASLPHLLHSLYRAGRMAVKTVQPPNNRTAKALNARRTGGLVFRIVGVLILIPFVAIALFYPVVGTFSRVAYRFPQPPAPTLDGLAFMHSAQFHYDDATVELSPEADAIAWLNEHITGTPIVAQSSLGFYRHYGVRIAANTGLPTITSSLHTNEQRQPSLAAKRDSDVQRLFNTADTDEALRLLSQYRVNYIYVGEIEHAYYRAEGVQKFADMVGTSLDVVYQNDGVRIYKVLTIPDEYTGPAPVEFDPSTQELKLLELEELEQQWQDNPTDVSLAMDLARRYRGMQRFQDAIRVLEPVVDQNVDNVLMQHVYGDLLVRVNRYDEAEEVYTRAAMQEPTSANWNKLGRELLSLGRIDKAELALGQAIAIDPVDPSAYYHLGRVYYQQGKHDLASKHLNIYLSLEPDALYSEDARVLLENISNGG